MPLNVICLLNYLQIIRNQSNHMILNLNKYQLIKRDVLLMLIKDMTKILWINMDQDIDLKSKRHHKD